MVNFKIYGTTNRINEKLYIGQTTQDLMRYLRADVTYAALHNHNRKPHLYNAIRKWGSENFDIQLILTAADKESADWWEQFFILILETQNPTIGYNIAAGGGGSFGYERVISDEQKEKLRIAGTGKKQSEETRAKRISTMTTNGKMAKSPEWRQAISEGKMGKKPKPFTDEHKRHMSEAGMGHFVSEETRKKQSESMKAFYARRKESHV
jgi:group I intron endonuclease